MFFLLCAWIKTVGKMASWYNMHVTQQTMERTHGLHMNIRDVRINSTSTFLSLHGSKVYSCLRHLLKTPLKSISKHPPPPPPKQSYLTGPQFYLLLLWFSNWFEAGCKVVNVVNATWFEQTWRSLYLKHIPGSLSRPPPRAFLRTNLRLALLGQDWFSNWQLVSVEPIDSEHVHTVFICSRLYPPVLYTSYNRPNFNNSWIQP